MNNITKHHDDSLYYECLAKIILEKRFKNWKLKILDKPDLQDDVNKIGIEVTQILPDGCNQAIALMKSGKKIDGPLGNKGYDLPLPGLMFHPDKFYERGKPFPTFDYLLNGIKNKIDKAHTYRKEFEELNLYVFTDNLDIDQDTVSEIFKRINEENNNEFDNVFIDAAYSIFHLRDGFAGKYCINREDYIDCQYRAIKMEEDIKNE